MDIKTVEMFKNDKYYDRKSLVFENGILTVEKDELDRENVPEGRLGEFMSRMVRANLGVTLRLPVTKKSESIETAIEVENTDKAYCIETADRFFSFEKYSQADLSALEEKFSGDDHLVKVSLGDSDRDPSYLGFVQTHSGAQMVGVVKIIDPMSDEGYVLKYAGCGNFTDIRMECDEILFSIKK